MLTLIDPTIAVSADLVQAQPPDLLRHSKVVSHLAMRLSLVAGCSPAEQEWIRTGSLLHDIGKQFLPDRILKKKGRLTPAEFHRIQEHPWVGYSYLTHFISNPILLQTVLYHHERWNGTGYPHGLKGDHIPLEARICSLADVWDALVSDRCYRSAWNVTQAMELIWAGAGSLFDPLLAGQFLTIIEDQASGAGAPSVLVYSNPSHPGPFAPALEAAAGPFAHGDGNRS
jgi:putative nucleotidyltransferase with HDIG domain